MAGTVTEGGKRRQVALKLRRTEVSVASAVRRQYARYSPTRRIHIQLCSGKSTERLKALPPECEILEVSGVQEQKKYFVQ